MTWAANGRWLDSAVIALLLAATPLIHMTDLSSGAEPPRRPVAVLFAPWVPANAAMQRMAETGARIVGLGRLPFIVIAEPADADFSRRAAAAGAFLTLNAGPFVACLTSDDAT